MKLSKYLLLILSLTTIGALLCNCDNYWNSNNPCWNNFKSTVRVQGKKQIIDFLKLNDEKVSFSKITTNKGALIYIYEKDSLVKIASAILDPDLPDTFYSMAIMSNIGVNHSFCSRIHDKNSLYKLIKTCWYTKTFPSTDSIAMDICNRCMLYKCNVKIRPTKLKMISILNNYKGKAYNGMIGEWEIITDNRMRLLFVTTHKLHFGKYGSSYQ